MPRGLGSPKALIGLLLTCQPVGPTCQPLLFFFFSSSSSSSSPPLSLLHCRLLAAPAQSSLLLLLLFFFFFLLLRLLCNSNRRPPPLQIRAPLPKTASPGGWLKAASPPNPVSQNGVARLPPPPPSPPLQFKFSPTSPPNPSPSSQNASPPNPTSQNGVTRLPSKSDLPNLYRLLAGLPTPAATEPRTPPPPSSSSKLCRLLTDDGDGYVVRVRQLMLEVCMMSLPASVACLLCPRANRQAMLPENRPSTPARSPCLHAACASAPFTTRLTPLFEDRRARTRRACTCKSLAAPSAARAPPLCVSSPRRVAHNAPSAISHRRAPHAHVWYHLVQPPIPNSPRMLLLLLRPWRGAARGGDREGGEKGGGGRDGERRRGVETRKGERMEEEEEEMEKGGERLELQRRGRRWRRKKKKKEEEEEKEKRGGGG